MRINRQVRDAARPESVLPLINVVFLLQIFFMVAGWLAAGDLFPVSPPVSASERLEPASVDILVLVDATGRIGIAGEDVPLAAVRDRVEILLASAGGGRAAVKVKADGQAEAVRVVEVMERLRAAGAVRTVLITERTRR